MKIKTMIGLACAVCFYGCAAAGDLENRVMLLEQQNAMLNRQLHESDSTLQKQTETNERLRSTVAEINASLDQLRSEIQSVTGRVDEVGYSVQKGQSGGGDEGRLAQVEELTNSNRDRITAIETYLNASPAPKPAGTNAAQAPAAEPAPTTDTGLYDAGKKAFDENRNDAALSRFQELISKYPKSDLAGSAQFWIGEIYYRQGSFAKAIIEYQNVVEKYPKGNKAAGAMLKQGLSFYSLNEKANAKLILQEMINKFPNSPEAKTAKDKLKTF